MQHNARNLALSPDESSCGTSLSSIEEGRRSWEQGERDDVDRTTISTATDTPNSDEYRPRSGRYAERSSLRMPDSPTCESEAQRKRRYDSSDDNPSSARDPLIEPLTSRQARRSRARNGWKRVSDHVIGGDVLLHSTFSGGGVGGNDDQDATLTTREEMVQDMQDKIRNSLEFSTMHCLIAISVYLGLAVLAFSFVFDRWTVVDSMYFAVVTFTTIGEFLVVFRFLSWYC